jgi:alpha-tubulin suppressor-like RCC1 family protein
MSCLGTGTGNRYSFGIPELESDYEFLAEIGRGGSAVVFRARDRELGRDVAIKVVHAAGGDADASARLQREARTVAQLQHPNIVTLFAVRRLPDQRLALVMQFVPGRTLREELHHEGALSIERAEQIVHDVASALAHAHARGVVHRDVKPENIFLDAASGRALLSDFGVARSPADTHVTVPGVTIGTPTYMSPEQIDGGHLDGRSDLYALGLVAWEMLSGRRPWEGETLFNTIYKQKIEHLPLLDELRPDVPDRLLYVVERLVEKSPDARWSSADELLADLPNAVPPDGWWRWHSTRRRGGDAAALKDRTRHPSPVAAALETVRFRQGRRVVPAAGMMLATDEERRAAIAARARMRDAAISARRPSRTQRAIFAIGIVGIAGAAAAVAIARATGDAPPTAIADAGALADRGAIEIPVAPPALRPSVVTASPLDTIGLTVSLGAADTGVAADASADSSADTSTVAIEDTASPVTVPRQAPAPVPDEPPARRAEAPPAPARRDSAPAVDSSAVDSAAIVRPPSVSFPTELGIVAPGGRHSCALAIDGYAYCWGSNDRGQLGDGTTAGHGTPARLATNIRFVQVASGVTSSCGVARAGDVYCWGENDRGQLGDGTTIPRTAPVRVVGPTGFRLVRVGQAHACGLTSGGDVLCWGSNSSGQLGNEAGEPWVRVSVPEGTRFGALSVGWQHACAISTDGVLWCWGRNTAGQLGDGTTTDRRAPVRVPRDERFVSVAAGSAHTCAVTTEGTAYCWGRNAYGQLGTGDLVDHRTPVPVEDGARFTLITAGSVHSCGRSMTGQVRCWGRNSYGQLGDGSTTDRARPVIALGLPPLATVQASASHTCGATLSGVTYCWGYNAEGQLGDGSRDNRARPLHVPIGTR